MRRTVKVEARPIPKAKVVNTIPLEEAQALREKCLSAITEPEFKPHFTTLYNKYHLTKMDLGSKEFLSLCADLLDMSIILSQSVLAELTFNCGVHWFILYRFDNFKEFLRSNRTFYDGVSAYAFGPDQLSVWKVLKEKL